MNQSKIRRLHQSSQRQAPSAVPQASTINNILCFCLSTFILNDSCSSSTMDHALLRTTARLVLRTHHRHRHRHRHRQYHRGSTCTQHHNRRPELCRLFNTTAVKHNSSNKNNNDTTTAAVTAAVTTTAEESKLAENVRTKQPFFSKIMPNHKNNNNNQGLFPWRSSSELLDRLIVGTNEYDKKGLLLGGNLTSSNPTMDFYATSYFFLRIPALDLLFFRNAVETDLLESMSYSFQYAIENAVVKGNNGNNGLLERMMEPKLAKLFNAAREFGKDSLQVKLEVQPININTDTDTAASTTTDKEKEDEEDDDDDDDFLLKEPKIVSMFVFPFLSRDMISEEKQDQNNSNSSQSQHLQKYKRMITLISEGEDEEGSRAGEGMQLSRELMIDFRNTKKGYCENTVIVQVLIPCNETFYVKDINNDNDNDNNDDEATSNIIQGTMNRRKVIHLVRFEQVTKTYIINNGRGLFPFRHELGEWQITDIDDLCNGNLLL